MTKEENMTKEGKMPEQSLADDLLRGVPAIAESRGDTERRTYYLLENRQIPGFKIGNIWHSRKSTQLRHIEGLEQEAMAS